MPLIKAFNLVLKSILTNLLIVEDNSIIGESIYNTVKNFNGIGNICLAKSFQEAISFLKENSFELITLDLKLPDGNGLEILKILKEKQVETKVFVFSMSSELKQICFKYGADAFFDKASDFDKLIEAIKTA